MQICFENICGKAHLSANQRRTAVSKQHSATAMFVVRFVADAPIFRLASSQTVKSQRKSNGNSNSSSKKGQRNDNKSALLAAARPAFARPDTHLTSNTTTWRPGSRPFAKQRIRSCWAKQNRRKWRARIYACQAALQTFRRNYGRGQTAVGNSQMKENERPADRYAGRRLLQAARWSGVQC